jgi:predicted small secreted protein
VKLKIGARLAALLPLALALAGLVLAACGNGNQGGY